MKRVKFIAILLIYCSLQVLDAQVAEGLPTDRTEISKLSARKLAGMIKKAAKAEAKKLSKEGWQSLPGAREMNVQLENYYTMYYETNENGEPKYDFAEGKELGSEFQSARAKANMTAQIELAKNAHNGIKKTEKVHSDILGSGTKTYVQRTNKRTLPITEFVKATENGLTMVWLRIAEEL